MQVGKIETRFRLLTPILCTEDRAALRVGRHHELMKGKPIQTLRRDPPFIKRQVFGSGLVITWDVILLNALQMSQKKIVDLLVHVHSSRRTFKYESTI